MAQQAAALQAATRQLDKLSVRSRLVSRDLKLPLQQLQAAAGQQSEALVGLAQRLEGHDKELRDMGELAVCVLCMVSSRLCMRKERSCGCDRMLSNTTQWQLAAVPPS